MGRVLKGGAIIVAMFLVGAGVALAGQELGQQDRDRDRVSTPDDAKLGDGAGEQKRTGAASQNASLFTAAAEDLVTDEAVEGEAAGADDAQDAAAEDESPARTRECKETAERTGAEDCDGDQTRTQTRTRDRDGECANDEPTQTRTRTRDRDCDGSGTAAQTQTQSQSGTPSQTATQSQSGTQTQARNGACDGTGPVGGGNGQGDCDGSGKGRSSD